MLGACLRTSTPPTSTTPEVTSNRRGTSETSVVLPEPVAPMIAVIRPAPASRFTLRSTGDSAPG